MPIAIAGCPPPGACESVAPDGLTGKKCKLAQFPSTNNSGWTSFTITPANVSTIGPMISEPATCSDKIPAVEVGSTICLYPGKATDSIYDDLKTFYSNNGDGLNGQSVKAQPSVRDCSLIPVVDASVSNFNQCDVPIISFARLCIGDVDLTGNPKFVYGDITSYQSLKDSLYKHPDPQAKNCYIPRLVRDKKSGM